jgi:uncharacterized membrane protein YdfJ with MMPL/SSD domain
LGRRERDIIGTVSSIIAAILILVVLYVIYKSGIGSGLPGTHNLCHGGFSS